MPTSIDGRVYLFCYVNRVIIDGVTSYSFEPIAPAFVDTASDKFEEVNYFEFQAASMEEAEKTVENKFPRSLGYVLDYIRTVTNEEG